MVGSKDLASIKNACQTLICFSCHPTTMYHGQSSHFFTHCFPSRNVNTEHGSGEKLGLWEEPNFSKGGQRSTTVGTPRFLDMQRKCRLGFMKKMQTAKC